ncbi:MAG: lysine--tRNA ligase [Hyphomicrobiales bacterium]|nr:lysine--tRNA ligase [Hyphomicrobiales bacterium]
MNTHKASETLLEEALTATAWPFVEARKLLDRVKGSTPAKGFALFETGYGPSGLPHIGTFGEVVRTTMVRHAFSVMSDIPTRLFAFSDDMDGLRSVPDNVPNQDMLAEHLGRPLTCVPDPFATHASFGEHNNARLRAFLDRFGFEYEFLSSTECYRSGRFDAVLLRILEHYDEVISVILPTLGPERRQTYSPFLPICADTGRVLQVPILERNVDAGTIVYETPEGKRVETPVTGGRCKLQWKVDWAMRWCALEVDYEMSGKDLIDSVRLSSRICKILDARPPETYIYELFLDEKAEKISKSKGNGLSVEDWLRYAPEESLSAFMFQKPRSAKRLYFDVIPKTVDDYIDGLSRYKTQDIVDRLNNPVWHIHCGQPPGQDGRLSFTILLNLVSVCHTEDKQALWRYISHYDPALTPATAKLWDQLLDFAIVYYRDFVKPRLNYRQPTEDERRALQELMAALSDLPEDSKPEAIQTVVYDIGKRHHEAFPNLKAWFRCLYQVLLGQDEGPRMGSFIALYGLEDAVELIGGVVGGQSPAVENDAELQP